MEPQKIPNRQNHRRFQTDKTILRNSKAGNSLYYKIMVMKRELYWHRKDT